MRTVSWQQDVCLMDINDGIVLCVMLGLHVRSCSMLTIFFFPLLHQQMMCKEQFLPGGLVFCVLFVFLAGLQFHFGSSCSRLSPASAVISWDAPYYCVQVFACVKKKKKVLDCRLNKCCFVFFYVKLDSCSSDLTCGNISDVIGA